MGSSGFILRDDILKILHDIKNDYDKGMEPFYHSGEIEFVLLSKDESFELIKKEIPTIFISEVEFLKLRKALNLEEAFWLIFGMLRHSLTHHHDKHMSEDRAHQLVHSLLNVLGDDCLFFSNCVRPETNWPEAPLPHGFSYCAEDFALFIFIETSQYKLFLHVSDID